MQKVHRVTRTMNEGTGLRAISLTRSSPTAELDRLHEHYALELLFRVSLLLHKRLSAQPTRDVFLGLSAAAQGKQRLLPRALPQAFLPNKIRG
jgi:hypothetical protein